MERQLDSKSRTVPATKKTAACQSRSRYYIAEVGQFGCLGYRELYSQQKYHDFAFRIYLDKSRFYSFDAEDQSYIKSVARLEMRDSQFCTDYQTLLNGLMHKH